MPPFINFADLAHDNADFRRIIYTGERSQLVVMSIPPHEEVGEERHDVVEQTIFCMEGSADVYLDDDRFDIMAGDVVVVPPGTTHNLVSIGRGDLKLVTIYAPPNHIDGRVHRTKAEADADLEDEEFGQNVRV